MSINKLHFFIFLLLLLLLSACYEPVEGCLDRRATNFDLDADEACASCCTYPNLQFVFKFVWADAGIPFSADSVYTDVQGQVFRVGRVRFYWSEPALQLLNGTALSVSDSITFDIAQGTDTTEVSTPNHFVLADSQTSSALSSGRILPSGTLESLEVVFGIGSPASRAVTTSLPSRHPLTPQTGKLNYGSELGYVFAQVELYRDTVAGTAPTLVNIYGQNALRNLRLPISPAATIIEGFNPRLNIQVDMASWFQGVNVRQADTTALQQQLLQNLINSFELTALTAH